MNRTDATDAQSDELFDRTDPAMRALAILAEPPEVPAPLQQRHVAAAAAEARRTPREPREQPRAQRASRRGRVVAGRIGALQMSSVAALFVGLPAKAAAATVVAATAVGGLALTDSLPEHAQAGLRQAAARVGLADENRGSGRGAVGPARAAEGGVPDTAFDHAAAQAQDALLNAVRARQAGLARAAQARADADKPDDGGEPTGVGRPAAATDGRATAATARSRHGGVATDAGAPAEAPAAPSHASSRDERERDATPRPVTVPVPARQGSAGPPTAADPRDADTQDTQDDQSGAAGGRNRRAEAAGAADSQRRAGG